MALKFSSKTKSQLIAIAVTLIALLFWYFLFEFQRQKQQSDENLEIAAYGNQLRTEVDRELNSLLFISNGMASYINVYRNQLEPDKIKGILADYWQRARHVRNLGIAVGYTLTYVYPEKNNEKVIGVDYRNLPKQWPKVKLAIDTKRGILDGPIHLLQGGSGIVYRYPIYLGDDYWGIMSTVIDTDAFLASAFKNAVNDGYAFAIRTGDTKQVFYGDPELFHEQNVFRQFNLVPNGQWEWAIKKNDSRGDSQLIITGVLSLMMGLLAGSIVYFFMRERYHLAEGALMDSLTGLPNRRLLDDRLNYAHSEAKRFHKFFGLVALDIDHFKSINDTYGHDVGDEVIRTVAQTLRATLRDIDTVSRVGGDEFILIVKSLHTRNDLIRIAGKLLNAFKQPVHLAGKEITVHLSLGLTLFEPDKNITLKQLHKQADIALYHSKQKGRNTYSVYEAEAQD